MPFIVGQVVNQRYTIITSLSEGGFSRIYLAFAKNENRMVTIKESKSSEPEVQNALLEEMAILQQIQHPHIPKIYHQFLSSENRMCVVMEYILGENLETFYTRGQTPSIETTLTWIRQILDALATLHTHNPPVVHRDVKLGNIQIHAITGNAYLIDFGISKMGSHTTTAAYTAPFAPPEQYGRGATTSATDVYAVGVCLYMLLTEHELPDGIARSNQPLKSPRELNPAISVALEQVMLKALALEVGERYRDAGEMLGALAQIEIEQDKQSSFNQLMHQFKTLIEPLHSQNRELGSTLTQVYEAQIQTLSQQLIQQEASVSELKAQQGEAVYTMGACLYLILTGHDPANEIEHEHHSLKRPREFNPKIPVALEEVIMKALTVEAEERSKSVREMMEPLKQLMLPAVELKVEEQEIPKIIIIEKKQPYSYLIECWNNIYYRLLSVLTLLIGFIFIALATQNTRPTILYYVTLFWGSFPLLLVIQFLWKELKKRTWRWRKTSPFVILGYLVYSIFIGTMANGLSASLITHAINTLSFAISLGIVSLMGLIVGILVAGLYE